MSSTSSAQLRAAILIVSDTASADPKTDKAWPILKETFASDGADKWDVTSLIYKIVPDDQQAISSCVKEWCDNGSNFYNLVITTGGTGFTPKDNTPEAIAPLLHRQAPGLVHGMLAASFEITPFAMMSRPVAGVRNKTVILTLPGSPKGAKENLQAVLKLLPHACMQAAGENSRSAHIGGVAKLEKDAGVASFTVKGRTAHASSHDHSHSHSHSHDHDHGHGHSAPRAHTTPDDRPPQSNDPRLGASHRARQSPFPMLEVPHAIDLILQHTPAPVPVTEPFSTSLVGAVVSEDIKAKEAVPAYRASIVDGYAVVVPEDPAQRSQMKGTFPVASISHAQTSLPPPLDANKIARITTGAPLPDGANAVVMVEDTVIASLTEDGEEGAVQILTDALVPGENIREPGSDIALGATILSAGQRIMGLGGEIGVLAASGTQRVPVYRRPRVGVLSTGDEVADVLYTGEISGGMIRDSNRPSLISLITSWGLASEVVDLGIARDTPHSELEAKLRDAYRVQDVDVLVTTGGVSMGELDLLKPTIERSLGGTLHFGRVNMKPGKPTTFGTVPIKENGGDRAKRLVFALPGNPASALVTANLFLLPALQKMAGMSKTRGLEKVQVRVAERVRCDKTRPEYHRCSVVFQDGLLIAVSTGMQRSSRVGSVGGANGLLCLPTRAGYLEATDRCECLMMGMLVGK